MLLAAWQRGSETMRIYKTLKFIFQATIAVTFDARCVLGRLQKRDRTMPPSRRTGAARPVAKQAPTPPSIPQSTRPMAAAPPPPGARPAAPPAYGSPMGQAPPPAMAPPAAAPAMPQAGGGGGMFSGGYAGSMCAVSACCPCPGGRAFSRSARCSLALLPDAGACWQASWAVWCRAWPWAQARQLRTVQLTR